MWEVMEQSHCWSILQEWVGMVWHVALAHWSHSTIDWRVRGFSLARSVNYTIRRKGAILCSFRGSRAQFRTVNVMISKTKLRNVRVKVTLWRFRITIVAVETQKCVLCCWATRHCLLYENIEGWAPSRSRWIFWA